jgi:hypothetical protein
MDAGVRKAVRESIEHWERMYVWVEGIEDKGARPDEERMGGHLGEMWGSEHCPLCDKFYERGSADPSTKCGECPLEKEFGSCIVSVTLNAYDDVAAAETWAGWLAHARRLLEQLRSLEE